jgi:import receptor subunit TOM70
MINKALCLFQKDKQLIGQAEETCRQALEKDPLCDIGIATLAQLYVQQNKIHQAVEMFERSVELARTEPELVHVLQYLHVRRCFLYKTTLMLSNNRLQKRRSSLWPITQKKLSSLG